MARVGFMIVIVIAIVTRDVVLIDRDAAVGLLSVSGLITITPPCEIRMA
jgi:hypothetical protein